MNFPYIGWVLDADFHAVEVTITGCYDRAPNRHFTDDGADYHKDEIHASRVLAVESAKEKNDEYREDLNHRMQILARRTAVIAGELAA